MCATHAGIQGIAQPIPQEGKRQHDQADQRATHAGDQREGLRPAIGIHADDRLQEHALTFARRMAQVPTSQLVMLKLLCNQTAENMGLGSSRLLGSLFDGIARHTQEGLDFVARARAVGFRQAVRERDDPFADYGSGPRRKKK